MNKVVIQVWLGFQPENEPVSVMVVPEADRMPTQRFAI
jgi:hypothetical protein